MAKRKSIIKKTVSGALFSKDTNGDIFYDLSRSTNILRDMNRAIIEETKKSGSNPGATKWFIDAIESGKMILPKEPILTEKILNNRYRTASESYLDFPGRMFAFRYYPKNIPSLKYYDFTPLIITLDQIDGNILGINLHYLPPELRAELIDKMLKISNYYQGEKMPPKGVGYFRIEYQMLKSMKYLFGLPCVRMYDPSRILGRPILIPSNEWGNATSLPFENFIKSSDRRVWIETKRKIQYFIKSIGSM